MPRRRELSRRDIMRLAAEAQLDPRTIERAVTHGIDALRIERDRERLRAAAEELRISLE